MPVPHLASWHTLVTNKASPYELRPLCVRRRPSILLQAPTFFPGGYLTAKLDEVQTGMESIKAKNSPAKKTGVEACRCETIS